VTSGATSAGGSAGSGPPPGSDSQTFQVVRTIKSFTGGLKGNSIIENDSWLPRSAALVKLISHPQIPAGFTRVPAPQ
jgi:hypothetical protein